MPAISRASPAAARPSGPATATRSPGLAPERRTGALPPRSPRPVTASRTRSARAVSPPITLAPARAHSAARPSVSSRAQLTGSSGGAASATSRPDGLAPIAAQSARLLAAALCPTSAAEDQSRRKCGPSSRKSVVATTRPSGVASTAASSPMPTSVASFGGSPADTVLITPNSPSEASVGGSSGAMTHLRTPAALPGNTGARVLHGLDLYGSVSEQGRLSRNPLGGTHGGGLHPRPDRSRQGRRRGLAHQKDQRRRTSRRRHRALRRHRPGPGRRSEE